MTWVRLDDRFPEHPKIVGLSDRAFRAHVTGLAYCARYLTDGTVPRGALPARRVLVELVAAGLWAPDGADACSIHDYLDWNLSKEERAGKAVAGAMGAAKRWHGKQAGKAKATASKTHGKPMAVPVPVPRSKPRAERERNIAFDALAEATGSDPRKLTRSAARTIGVALAEIAEAESNEVVGPFPPDIVAKNIRRAAVLFRQRHPEWELTPMSLAKWWPTCQEIVYPVPARVTSSTGETWETEPPWIAEGLTWEQWHRRESGETDVGPDSGTSGGAPGSGPTQEPPAEETG